MIQVEFGKYKSRQQELKVVQLIRDIGEAGKLTGVFFMKQSLAGIQMTLTTEISQIKRKNNFSADLAYKVTRHTDDVGQHLKVQHYSVEGNPKRLIAIIRDSDNKHDNWNDNEKL